MGPKMISPSQQETQHPPLHAESLEAAARLAFAEHVRLYDEQDQIIVRAERHELRLVYLSIRASRQSSSATFIRCGVDSELRQMWINSLQVSDALRRQGVGREMVEATEATARAVGISSVKVYPLVDAAAFWETLGYTADTSRSRVLHKEMTFDVS